MIGFFDSGVGGLSILQDVVRLMPGFSTVYLSDTANFPYGQKSEVEVQTISGRAIEILMRYSPIAVVVACNTASTSALPQLRQQFPSMPIVGVVPALKPAAAVTTTGKIGLLATTRTLQSAAYQELKSAYAKGLTVIDQPCPGWVEMVEIGHVNDAAAEEAVDRIVTPLAKQGVDTYVLGCTHYPFLRSLIERYAGVGAHVIDSGLAVAQQLQRLIPTTPAVLESRQQLFLSTGAEDNVSKLMSVLLGHPVEVELVS